MQTFRTFALSSLGALLTLAAVHVHASDRVAVYARIDRVVLAPEGQAPQTIQVFGVFSIAAANSPSDYQPPVRGYLYFTLPDNPALARREWNDLKEVAGTKQIVAFGTRYAMQPRLRATDAKPDAPDTYVLASGITKVNGTTDYPPVRGLVDFR